MRPLSLVCLVVVLLPALVKACAAERRSREPQQREREQTRGTEDAASSAAPSATVTSSLRSLAERAVRSEIDRGCAQDIDASLSPEVQIETMGRWCAAGLRKLAESAHRPVSGDANRSERIRIELRRYACVRVGVVAQRSEQVLQVRIEGPGGVPIESRESLTPLLLGRDGPICVHDDGTYTVHVQSLGAPAQVWIALWGSPDGALR